MKRARKYAFGGFENGDEKKKAEARKVDSVPDGYTEEPSDPSFPNRKYYRKEINTSSNTPQSVTPVVRRPIVTNNVQSSKKRVLPTNQVKPISTNQSTLDRIYLEPQQVQQQVAPTPVEAFMGDTISDASGKTIGRLRNRSRNLDTGAGTNNTGQEVADFMYTQPDVKGAPVDSTRGKFSLNTEDIQNLFGTGRVMNKDVAGYKNKTLAKMATGGTIGATDIINAGQPILDGLMSILDGNNSMNYSRQPIMNAATIHNMATPYDNPKFGTGGTVDDLSDDELAQLQEEADSQGITVEELLQQQQEEGQSQNDGDGQDSEGTDDIDQQNYSLADQYDSEFGDQQDENQQYAMGGKVPIEVEGGEVMEHPNGNLHEVDGPSHEEGGVDVDVPHGTKIYSDRLSIDGKTMQERKVKRERNLAKLEKLTKDNTSVPLKNTLMRTKQISDLEDKQDMQLQEMVKNVYQGNMPTREKHGTGGTIRPYRTPTQLGYGNMDMTRGSTLQMIPNTGTTALPTNNNSSNDMGVGDYVGMAGNLFNAVAPIINTNNAARATRPVLNRFQGFGHNALDDNQSAQSYVNTEKTNANTDLNTSSNSAFSRNRSSARNVNTVRALDIATEMGKNRAKNSINSTFSNQMMQLLGQRGQLHNQADAYQMQGQMQADDKNAANVDNYYSNMAANLTNFGTNIEDLGRNLNTSRRNQDDEDMIGSMTQNGIAMRRKKGRYKIVNNS